MSGLPRVDARVTAAMHDNPSLWPTLPPREPDPWMLEATSTDEWRTCWEFVLSHTLTPSEGSAFWHGANLAMTSAETRIAELESQLAAARSALGAEAAQDDVSGDLAGPGGASGPEGHLGSSSRSNRLNRKDEVRGAE